MKKSILLCCIMSLACINVYARHTTYADTEYGLQTVQVHQAARRVITGTVKDEDGLPIPGVYVAGGGKTVITDKNGYYKVELQAENQIELTFSCLGKETQRATVGKSNELNIVLISSATIMDDVVVVGGYGLAQKRSEMVGSAFQIDADKIKSLPAVRVDNLLEGIVPGLSIDFNSDSDINARPRLSTRVRGEGSLSAGSEPIWIVDGTRIYTGGNNNNISGMQSSITPLSYLNPDDIESITVLKDANSVAIYGADGSNGVILVTTKGGSAHKHVYNVSVKFGVAQIDQSSKFKVLNGAEYMTLAREAYLNRYSTTDPNMLLFPFQDTANNSYSTTDTDWYKQFFTLGNMQDIGLSMSGGSRTFKNYISVNYFRNSGTLKGNTQNRFSLRFNSDIELHKRLSLSIRTAFSYNINSIFSPGNDYLKFLPIISPRNEDGSFRLFYDSYENVSGVPTLKTTRFFNSLAERDENDNIQRTLWNTSSVSLKYDVFSGFSLTGYLGMNYTSSHETIYKAMSNWSGREILDNGKEVGFAERNSVNNFQWNGDIRANYNKTFGKHKVGALVGGEIKGSENRYISARGNTFANDYVREISEAVNTTSSGSQTLRRNASFFGQASYSYANRYFLSVNGRMDGSSDFGEDVKWGTFGSVGVSWNIHNEEFFRSKVINILKIKASYGTAGNSRLGNVQAKGIYSYGNSYMGTPTSTMSSIKNRRLSWETSYTTNVGLRIRLFDRLDIDLEAYSKITDNLISSTSISLVTGQGSLDTNFAKMQNRGVEAVIESLNIDNKDFSWTTTLNISLNRNKILRLYVPKLGATNKVWREGQDVNTWNLVRWAGVNPRNGEPLWYDADGNITNTYSANYAVPCKSSTPDLEGGLINSFRYKNITLSMIMTFGIGGYGFGTYNHVLASDGQYLPSVNTSVNELDRWQKPGDIAAYPKPIWGISTGSTRTSTRYLMNKTHLRFKNISLGYSIPERLFRGSGISNLNLSLIVDNVAFWTLYGKSDKNTYKQARSGYPAERVFSIGINLSF